MKATRVLLALLLSVPPPARALERPARSFNPQPFTLIDEVAYEACQPGVNVLPSNAGVRMPAGSPSPSVTPTYNSLNTAPSAWGAGWHEASDAAIRLEADGSATWTDGQGTARRFAQEPPALGDIALPEDPELLSRLMGDPGSPVVLTAAQAGLMRQSPPRYRSPVNTYETLVYSSGTAGKVPTELRLEAVNGDKTTFRAFESTGVLRPALMEDRNGNTLTYQRDAQGRLIKVEDVHGRYTSLTYEGGLVKTLSDHAGRSVVYGYDGQDRKTSEDGFAGLTRYEYDGTSARVARVIYPNGSFRRYEYDAEGRVTLEESDGAQERLSYVYESTRTLVTDALGKTTVREHTALNGAHRTAKVTDPLGGVSVLDYDGNLNLVARRDPRSNATAYVYDLFGNVTRTESLADNAVTSVRYDGPFHQPSLVTDPRGVTTLLGYDAQKGDLTSVTTPDGVTAMNHDPFGHVTQSDPPEVPATTFGYDPATGALNLVTDPLGRATQLERDSLSRVKTNIDPKGKRTDFTYDDDGNLKTVREYILGQTLETRYEYVVGRANRLLSAVTDAKGQRTEFTYDALGRLRYVANPVDRDGGKRKEFDYDAKGRLAASLDPNGNRLAFTYDDLDRLTLKDRPDGDASYGYDANGNLTSVTNPNGSIAMTYDGRDRLETVVQTVGGVAYELTYGYDKNGNRTSMTTPWGTFLYTYDAMNRLDTLTVPASLGAPSRTFDFDYDAAGRRTKLTYPNNTEAIYTYDSASQVTEIRHKLQASTHTLALAQYTYDQAGNRTTMTDLNGTHFYGYDELHRATAAVHPPASSLPVKHEVFSYDAVGNRLADARATGYSYDSANRLLSDSLFTYENDDNGNRTAKVERATGERTDYAYDDENNLVQAAVSGVGPSWQFDGLNRRVGEGSGTRWIYDEEDVLAEYDGANALRHFFVHGPGIDEPLMMRKADGADLFMLADALGSVTAHVDAGGEVVERIEYEIYGLPTFIDWRAGTPATGTGSWTGSRFAFTGREWDGESRRYHYRARSYDPRTGTFLTEEPLGIDGPNLYWYALSNPIRYGDPTGYAAWSRAIGTILIGGGIAAGIEIGVQLYSAGGDSDCLDWREVMKSGAWGAALSSLGPSNFIFGRAGTIARERKFQAGALNIWEKVRVGWSWHRGRNWFGIHGGAKRLGNTWHRTPIPGPAGHGYTEFAVGGGMAGGLVGAGDNDKCGCRR